MAFIATLIFVVAVLASAGVYGYKYVLEDRIDQKGIALTEARSLIQMDQINEFKLLDQRLDTAWGLLRNHKITSAFFDLLEANTLHNVQFDSYQYLVIEGGDRGEELTIRLDGQAASFEALVLQADMLRRQTLISDVAISNIGRETMENTLLGSNNIRFSVEAQLNPVEVAYVVSTNEQQE